MLDVRLGFVHTCKLRYTMTALRIFLIAIVATLAIYTLNVGIGHGWNLFPIFFNDIFRGNWSGQFNLDFTFMLMISALWTAWRNRFTALGFALGFLALIGGSLFLSTYLFVLTYKHKGNITDIMLGSNRSQA